MSLKDKLPKPPKGYRWVIKPHYNSYGFVNTEGYRISLQRGWLGLYWKTEDELFFPLGPTLKDTETSALVKANKMLEKRAKRQCLSGVYK